MTDNSTFAAALARSRDVVMFFTADGTITWVSEGSRTVFGVAPAELIGQNGFGMIHPDDRERVLGEFAGLERLGDAVRTEFRVVLHNGETRWVEEIAANYLADPTVGAVVANLRDVTDRHRAEEAVVFQARLLAAVGQPVFATDTTGQVVSWNDAACALFGWSSDEVVGQNISDVIPVATESSSWAAIIATQSLTNDTCSSEFDVHRRDQEVVPIELTTTPLYDEAGALSVIIGTSTDLTERRRSEQLQTRLSAIIESSTDAIFSEDLDGRILTWNQAAADLFGYTAAEIIGRSAECLAPPQLRSEIGWSLRRIASGEALSNRSTVRRRSNGEDFNASVTVSPVRDREGRVVAASLIVRDVTDQVTALEELDVERRHLAAAQEAAHLGSFEIDMKTGKVRRSDELWRILGLEPDPDLGIDFSHIHPDDVNQVRSALEGAYSGDADVGLIHRIVRPDGEIRWVQSRRVHVYGAQAGIISGTMLDITERRTAEATIEHIAFHDALTGLRNRAWLESPHGRPASDDTWLAAPRVVALINIDNFAAVNDSLGTRSADAVLQQVAARLAAGAGESAILCRYGGDEFVVIDADDEPDALVQQVCSTFDAPVQVGHRSITLTASVGAKLVEPADTLETAIRDAGTALAHARRTHTASAIFNDRLRVEQRRRQQIQLGLETALDGEQLSLVFQPIVTLDTQQVVGFESLLRWDHPTLGRVAPSEFIPMAERTGMIVSVGNWVIRQALAQIAFWRSATPANRHLWVAVNLSARQLEQPSLAEQLREAIRDAGVAADALHLEVTESLLMANISDASTTLSKVRDVGVRISLDDFGTGYSSLSYLKDLPIDALKIDRSFIASDGSRTQTTPIIQTIVDLADNLDLDVVAEGVETAQQLAMLLELGCHYGQGFLWSRGLDPSDATEWLESARAPGFAAGPGDN